MTKIQKSQLWNNGASGGEWRYERPKCVVLVPESYGLCLLASFSHPQTAPSLPPPNATTTALLLHQTVYVLRTVHQSSLALRRYSGEEYLEALFSLHCFSGTLSKMSLSMHTSAHKHRTMIHQTLFSFAEVKSMRAEFKNLPAFLDGSSMRSCQLKDKSPCDNRGVVSHYHRPLIHSQRVDCMANGDTQELSEEEDELCPVECVREIKTDEELLTVLEKAKKANSLVVVDFYRTACGSCKYIEHGFVKLCKGSGDEDVAVIFLKHNVIDEYDEQSEIAERLRIKTVPLFHFYKNGILLEAFPTRDKERIKAAIEKYTAPAPAPAT